LGAVFLTLIPLLILFAAAYSETGNYSLSDAMRAILAELGLISPNPENHLILKLRLMRALCAIGVGGTLALAGAMAQGLFRNPMAEPGLLGVSSGASLGAILAIALLGGYGPDWKSWSGTGAGSSAGNSTESWLTLGIVPAMAMLGALSVGLTVYRLSTRRGKLSVPVLLLTGLAINSLLGAMIAILQVLLVADWQVARAILSWGFGTVDDRTSYHLGMVWVCGIAALATIPWVGLELDLLAGGEEDAAALGANPAWVKTLVLACIAIATAAAVSVSGQIGFIGLLVPHLVRKFSGPHHRILLPLSFLAGAALLLGVVVLQHGVAPAVADQFAYRGYGVTAEGLRRFAVLQPGVITALFGSPFFLWVLLRQSKDLP
jgi:iron complex transport system permease protein